MGARRRLSLSVQRRWNLLHVGEGEKAKQDTQSVQDKIGKAVSTRTEGAYTVAKGSINMTVMVNGKSRRMRMAYRKIDPDTLWLGGQDYRRERDG
jgi:hypothetical protein